MRKTKFSLLVIIALMLVFCFISCRSGENDSSGGDGDPNNGVDMGGNDSDVTETDWIFSDEMIFVYDFFDAEADNLYNSICQRVAGYPRRGDFASLEMQGVSEIIIGDSGRELSDKAYRKLETNFDLSSSGQTLCAWLILYEDDSVAIAYSNNTARQEAIRYFAENFVETKASAEKEGILKKDSFDLVDYAESYLEERRTKELDALVDEVGVDTVDSLKRIFSLYTQDLYIWMVNLYDPVTGGFYWSNSARNNTGYLPDIQSTCQVLNWLTNTGMRTTGSTIPAEIKQQMLDFAISLQSPVDGYFYHPQWGTNITTSKKGRDLGWATQIISSMGGVPLYDTPSGVKGSLGAPGAVSAVTTRLSNSEVIAVSKVVSAASTLPDYLKSIEKWDEYLKSLNIMTRSYWAGNTLAAQHSQIAAAGKEYVDYLINYLNSIQNQRTGLWAYDTSTDPYHEVNGLMKISSVYAYYNAVIPNAEKALEACFDVIMLPDGDNAVTAVYNPWITIYQLLTSINRSEGAAKVEALRARILEMAPALIDSTCDKIALYRCADGSFGTVAKFGRAQNLSQDSKISCATEAEGDVDGSSIASAGIITNIFKVLGCTEVKLYSSVDYDLFRIYWQDMGEIIKDDNSVKPELITFDDYDVNDAYFTESCGSVVQPHDYVTVTIGDTELTEGGYKWFSSSVVNNPVPGSKASDLVLRCETFRYDEEKDRADKASSTKFAVMGDLKAGNCFVYDADMYFENGTGAECIGEFQFGYQFVWLTLLQYESGGVKYMKFAESYAGLDGVKDQNVAKGIPYNEWVNIRIEVYQDPISTDDGSYIDIKVKIYINGEYAGECDAGYVSTETGRFTENTASTISYSHYRHAESVVYFNNVMTEKITKKFVSEKPISMIYPEVLFFEDDNLNSHSNQVRVSNGSDYLKSEGSYAEIQTVKDENGNDTRAAVFSSNAGGVDNWRVYRASSAKGKNLFTYESKMKMIFDENSNGGISFFLGSVAATSYNAYRFKIGYDLAKDTLTVYDASASSALIGETVELGVKSGEWFDLKVNYYELSDYHILVIIYINNEQVYVSDNYYNPTNDHADLTWPIGVEYTMPNGSKAPAGVSKVLLTTDNNCDVDIIMDEITLNWYGVEIPTVTDDDYNSRYHKDDGPAPKPETNEGNRGDVITFVDETMSAEGEISLEIPSGYVNSPDAEYGVSVVKNSSGEDTYAFVIDSNKGASDRWRIVKGSEASVGKNLFSFTTDIKLDFNEGSSGNIDIFLGSTVTQNYNAYRLSLGYNAVRGELTLKDSSVNGECSGSVKTLNVDNGEWFNLKIEYYEISDSEILVLVYINGVVAYVSNNYYNSINNNDDLTWSVGSSYITPGGNIVQTGISKVQFATDSNTDVTVTVDNSIIEWIDAKLPTTDTLSYDSKRNAGENLPPLTPDDDSSTLEDIEQNRPDDTWQ